MQLCLCQKVEPGEGAHVPKVELGKQRVNREKNTECDQFSVSILSVRYIEEKVI